MPQAAGELLCRLRKHCEKVSWTGGGYYRREWRYRAFERGFTLPEGTTGEDITASYRNGVLEVIVPKAAQRVEPRQIPVSVVNGKNAKTALTTSPGSA
jgi:HSP20 family protein